MHVAMNAFTILLSFSLLQILILPTSGYFITSNTGQIYYYEGPATWDEAMRNCRRKGDLGRNWSLATLESCEHISDVCQELDDDEVNELWMDVRQNVNGTFVKNGIEDANAINWVKGEPSNGLGEDCVVLIVDSMEWDNIRCDAKREYLCVSTNESSSMSEQLPTTLSQKLELSKPTISSLTTAVTSKSSSSDTEIGVTAKPSTTILTTTVSSTTAEALSTTPKFSMSTTSTLATTTMPTSHSTKGNDIDIGTDTLYSIENTLATWDEAVLNCQRKGTNWHLATLDSYAEADGLGLYLYTASKMWIGIRRSPLGTFTRIGNEQSDFFQWASGQPSNRIGEDCVELNPEAFEWNTANCDFKQKYICARAKESSKTAKPLLTGLSNERKISMSTSSSLAETDGNKIEYIDIGKDTLYSIESTFATWDDAAFNCQMKGTNWSLATFDSIEDLIRLFPYIRDRRGSFWIGVRKDSSGTFVRIGNHTNDFYNWAKGEPYDHEGEDCVELNSRSMEWYNFHCVARMEYICASSKIKASTTFPLPTVMMSTSPTTESSYIATALIVTFWLL